MGTVIDERGFQAAGRALERARLSVGETLDQVSGSLGIRPLFLEALERGELGRVLGPTYAESMIVRYAIHLGVNPEALLSAAAKRAADGPTPGPRDTFVDPPAAVRGRPVVPAVASPDFVDRPALWEGSSADVTATPVWTPQAPRRSRQGSGAIGDSSAGGRRGPSLLRLAVITVLAAALVATGLFGAAELGVFSVFTGRDTETTELSDSSAAAGPTGDVTPTTIGPTAPSTTTVISATTLLASTTTTAVQVAVPFSMVLEAKEDVWVEFRDATSGEALHVGMVAKDDSLSLEATGPVNAVVGKPGSLTLQIDGRSVQPPNSFRWLVSSTGVQDRP